MLLMLWWSHLQQSWHGRCFCGPAPVAHFENDVHGDAPWLSVCTEENASADANAVPDTCTAHAMQPALEHEDEQLHVLKSASTDEVLKTSTDTSTKSVSLVASMKLGVQSWRRRMSFVEEPNHLEHSRGVIVEPVYEFFDPVAREVRVRKMNESVLHQRVKTEGGSASGEESSDTSCSISSSPISPSSLRSRSSGSSSIRLDRKLKRTRTLSKMELVSKWGVLIGKILHHLVVDLATLSRRALRKKTFDVFFEQRASHTWCNSPARKH